MHQDIIRGIRVTYVNYMSGYELRSIHQASDPVAAVEEAEALFVGGGNTFQLLKALYDKKLIEPIRKRVLQVAYSTFVFVFFCQRLKRW